MARVVPAARWAGPLRPRPVRGQRRHQLLRVRRRGRELQHHRRLWRYDADTDTWTELAPVPEGGEGPTAACLEGKIHVMGGDGTDRHYVYDVATDTWTPPLRSHGRYGVRQPPPLTARSCSPEATPTSSSDGTSNEVNIYDIASDTWTTGAPMPVAASTPGFAQAGELLYVVGGWGDNAPASNVDVTQRYDISGDAWETGPTFESARADLALSATGYRHLRRRR